MSNGCFLLLKSTATQTAVLAILFNMLKLWLICLAQGMPSQSDIFIKSCLPIKSTFKNILLHLYQKKKLPDF